MISDPISDMLTRIRNAAAIGKVDVVLPYSNMKYSIAKILEKEGYLQSVEKLEQGKFPELKVNVKYSSEGKSVVKNLKMISKPSRRVYATVSDLPRVLNNFGIAIISTPNGLMTNKDARRRCLGGEVICEIY